jgi:hypothetical protein
MRLLDRQSSLFIVLLCLPLLFLPKINLITLGEGETAGLRIDDFFLLAFSLILMWAHFTVRKGLLEIEVAILSIVGFSLVSFLSNKILVSMDILQLDAKLFYCLRLLEYFLFFYIGTIAARFCETFTLIKTFFLWNLFWMVLQRVGLIGEFSSIYGYQAEGAARVSGIASFPSEMGGLLNLMFCYFLFAAHNSNQKSFWSRFSISLSWRQFFKNTYIYWLFLFFAVLTIMTGSRVAIVALIVPFLFKLKSELNLRSLNSLFSLLLFILCAVVMITYMIIQTDSIFERSRGLLSWKNLELAGEVWDKLSIEGKLTEYPENVVTYNGQDMSWWIRIHKWAYIFKVYFVHPECYLQGLGPGCAWAALDGGFLRILVETGFIGCFLFWRLFAAIYQKSLQLKWMCMALFFNMLFFDAYLAYKLMSLLFVTAGCEFYTQPQSNFREINIFNLKYSI